MESLTNGNIYTELRFGVENKLIKNFRDDKINDYLKTRIKNLIDIGDDEVKTKIRMFFLTFHQKWNNCNRTHDVFVVRCKEWLSKVIYEKKATGAIAKTTKNFSGRPTVPFNTASRATKYRKSNELALYSPDKLKMATSISLRKRGNNDEADVLKNLSNPNSNLVFSANKALAMMIDLNLSKENYQYLRNEIIDLAGVSQFPPYNFVRDAKELCFPALKDDWIITDFSVELNLQKVVDHTAKRIFEIKDVYVNKNENLSKLIMYSKVGFDGSTGQSIYKQISEEDRNFKNESGMFMTCLVPLKIVKRTSEKNEVIIWENKKPSSTRYCRPIKFEFIKETDDVIIKAKDNIKGAIEKINPTIVSESLSVYHEIFVTMIDGKVATILSPLTSSFQCCSICGARPTQMNDLETLMKCKISPETLGYGISSLHAWIRSLECILHIAYKLPIKKWQAKTPKEKEMVKERKADIQKRLKDSIGLVVDLPKSGGSGTSNDGNTARKFFKLFDITSDITKVDKDLIKKIYVILCTISSGYEINTEEFKRFSLETYDLYIKKYKWYYMPQSLHKLLIHGSDIIENFHLPIGLLSEESQEARNKDFRNFRERFTRKISRKLTNEDIMSRLLCSSDPLISSLRKDGKTIKMKLPDECYDLINC